MRKGRFVGLVTFALAALAVPAATWAQLEKTVTLQWSAPPECPDSTYVRGEIARQLGSSGAPPDRNVRARGQVTKDGKRWHLSLEVEVGEKRGERALDAESCRAAADATALIVAMAVDPSRALRGDSAIVMTPIQTATPAPTNPTPPSGGGTPSPNPIPTTAPPPSSTAAPPSTAAPSSSAPPKPAPTTPSKPPPPPSPPRSRPSPNFAFGPAVLGDIGTFHDPNLGLSAFLAWTPSPFRLEISGEYWSTQTIDLPLRPPNPPRGARLDLATVGLLGCYAVVLAPIEVSPCGGAEIGQFSASSFGVSDVGAGGAVWAAFRLGGLVAWRIVGPFAIRATVEGLAPITRPTFQITGIGVDSEVHRPGPLSGRAGVGAEIRF